MKRSEHPRSCTVCCGTGWAPGPPRTQTVYGLPHSYTTYRPCTHEWRNDDPGWTDPEDQPIPWDHPRARAAYTRGYDAGHRERLTFDTCPCPYCQLPLEVPDA